MFFKNVVKLSFGDVVNIHNNFSIFRFVVTNAVSFVLNRKERHVSFEVKGSSLNDVMFFRDKKERRGLQKSRKMCDEIISDEFRPI